MDGCGREKYWSEADADLKAERCRRKIYELQEEVKELKSIARKLLKHIHSGDKLACIIEESNGASERCSDYWKEMNRKDTTF